MRKMIADMLPVAIVLFLIISVLSVTEETFIVGNVIRAVHSEPELDINIIQSYIDLANNEKIVPYLKLTEEEKKTFFKKIMELETGKTISWDKFKGKLMLTYDDIREIWLQRIVLTLYNEIHNTFNWKILSYNSDELKSLLEFCVYDDLEYQCSQGFQRQNNGDDKESDGYRFRFVINDNPLEPLSLVDEMFVSQNKLPEEVISQEQALELLAKWMNENNWQHAYKGNLNLALSYKVIGKTKQTTSHSNREFLQATLRAMNIPSENLFITDQENAVH